jgi:hypothetical protein
MREQITKLVLVAPQVPGKGEEGKVHQDGDEADPISPPRPTCRDHSDEILGHIETINNAPPTGLRQ